MNIEECFESLRKGYGQWSDLFANPKFSRSKDRIQWHNLDEQRLRLPAVLDAEEFFRTVENGQYSFQLLDDGAIIRLGYSFDARGRALTQANLSYIRPPSENIVCQRESIEGFASAYVGYCDWLRVDYVPETVRVPTHAACHMHLSSMPSVRIPLSRVPTPRQFIGWIVSFVAPHKIHELISLGSHLSVNAPCFVNHWEDDLSPFFFLAVPPNDAKGQLAMRAEDNSNVPRRDR